VLALQPVFFFYTLFLVPQNESRCRFCSTLALVLPVNLIQSPAINKMKINFLQLAALAFLGTHALATPIAEPVATNAVHEKRWDPVSLWYSFWEWVHQHQGDGDNSTCKKPLVRKEWYVPRTGTAKIRM
jgi:hypothetical protein